MMNSYENENVRRQDRLLPKDRMIDILNKLEYGVLSIVGENIHAYGIPLCFVWDESNTIYFHSALKGRKIENISNNKNVSFCIVTSTKVLPEKYTIEYESVIIEGDICLISLESERKRAAELMLKKYSPNCQSEGQKYTSISDKHTLFLKLCIVRISGKCNKR